MKNKYIQLCLLFSLFFNIAHASIIALEDKCQHETAYEYVLEQSPLSKCTDLCNIHYLFHFIAILETQNISGYINDTKENIIYKSNSFFPLFFETVIKPPIV